MSGELYNVYHLALHGYRAFVYHGRGSEFTRGYVKEI